MNYILTQEELDALEERGAVNAEKVISTLLNHMLVRTVCLDVNLGPETVIYPKDFKAAVEKTRQHYASK